jgi:hypothetical protein
MVLVVATALWVLVCAVIVTGVAWQLTAELAALTA